MRGWLDRAVGAKPDPRYVCAACGGESLEWRSRCSRCGAFDTLSWRTPAWAVPAAAPPIPTGLGAALELAAPPGEGPVPIAMPNVLAATLEPVKNQPIALPR